MRIEHADPLQAKGWYLGAWNSPLPVAVGYAHQGIDEPHEHSEITEIYLVARGTVEIRVEKETIALAAGDMIVIEPHEAHTFLRSSPDYLHFVIHTPTLAGEAARAEKRPVGRERLGL